MLFLRQRACIGLKIKRAMAHAKHKHDPQLHIVCCMHMRLVRWAASRPAACGGQL